METIKFELRSDIECASLAAEFAREGRVQIRNVLSDGTAHAILHFLQEATPWGLAFQAGTGGATRLSHQEFRALSPDAKRRLDADTEATAARGDYAFRYGQYPMLDAYREKWAEGGPHDWLIEHINDQSFLDLVRKVTGMPDLKKADAQATFYAPGHFLSRHSDSHVAEGWKVAYVLNLCAAEWRADWGGYLNFLDENGDIVTGWRPRFNTLNLFAVPQDHQVSYVPPFAPFARYAITGWFRDL